MPIWGAIAIIVALAVVLNVRRRRTRLSSK